MKNDFQDLFAEIQRWAEKSEAAGWLSLQDLLTLKETQEVQIEKLFREHGRRPLIVAFFGGTGVGKSSLLNRLAGEDVARTGMERPTSMEVTLYLHEDYKDQLLPDELPTRETRIAYHRQDHRQLVAWLDLPDIDSTERHNEELVQAWLPYVDWIIYVVSPDRYHDEMGWRFLLARGHRHAWLFIMNHWDEGKPEQIDDFRNRLLEAGFDNPTILRSVCTGTDIEDDFTQLEKTINDAIHDHGLAVLQELGLQAHIEEVSRQLDRFQSFIDNHALWQAAETEWAKTTDIRLDALSRQLEQNAGTIHLGVRTQESSTRLFSKADSDDDAPSAGSLARSAWNPRNQMRIEDLCARLTNQVQSAGLPFHPLASRLDAFKGEAQGIIKIAVEEHLASALEQPGTRLQRKLYQLSRYLVGLLPILAASWAGIYLVIGFYSGTRGEKSFLGLDFAIHSILLIALAWLIPWLIQRKLKPSLADAIKPGLAQGNTEGIIELKNRFNAIWNSTRAERQKYAREIQAMQSKLKHFQTDSLEQLEGYVGKERA